jgi:hypothetical protein
MSVEVAKDAAQAAPAEVKDDSARDEARQAQEEYRALHFARRRFRSQLVRFQKGHKYQVKKLGELSKESTDEDKKACAKHTYQLLRLFCFTYNYITILEKDADRQHIPADFEAEIKEVLTDAYFTKYQSAIKAKKEDYENELPAEVSADVIDKLIKFVSVKETDHITAKYEVKLAELTEQVDAKKKERGIEDRPKAAKKPSKKKVRRNSESSSKEVPLEDQLTAVLNEVRKRTDSVRFSKDDFESLSDA